MSDFDKGHNQGIDDCIGVLNEMERRYRQWAAANPGIDGVPASAQGKIAAVTTAKRAMEKLKKR